MSGVGKFNRGDRTTPPPDVRVITFHPAGNGYGTVSCNWEDEPRKGMIAEWTIEKFAEGWHAKLKVEAAW